MRKDLKVKAIPVPEGSDHPEPPHGMGLLPIHEFTMGLIAPKGKGKTTTIINLLDFYKGYFHQIWVFSPTIKSDVKWKYAQNQETLGENTKLKQFVLDCKKKQVQKKHCCKARLRRSKIKVCYKTWIKIYCSTITRSTICGRVSGLSPCKLQKAVAS